jgi:hypothetical protein
MCVQIYGSYNTLKNKKSRYSFLLQPPPCLGWFVTRVIYISPVALQSLKDLGRLTYRRFLELFRHMVRLLGRVISPSQGLYLHRTTQHRKTRTKIHALSGIRTHDPSNQPAKTHASDRTATVTDIYIYILMLLVVSPLFLSSDT